MSSGDTPKLQMPGPVAIPTDPEVYQAFAIPQAYGVSVPMVELRLKTGDRVGLAYPWLGEVRYAMSSISLVFTTGVTVSIHGRNLGPLYAALIRQEAVFVWEADAPTAELVINNAPVVVSISVTAGQPSPR